MLILKLKYTLFIVLIIEGLVAGQDCVDNEIRLFSDRGLRYIDYCINGQWSRLCTGGGLWGIAEANVVCRQLGFHGYNLSAASPQGSCMVSVKPTRFFRFTKSCTSAHNTVQECGGVTAVDCGGTCNSSTEQYGFITGCLREACNDGQVRLVDGEPNRSGRVEVCLRGAWGTLCTRNQPNIQQIANRVCTVIRKVEAVGLIQTATPGFVPIRECDILNGVLTCVQVNNASCDHSMDLTVDCRTYQELQDLTKPTPPTCPTSPATTCPECPTTTTNPLPTCPSVTCQNCPTITTKPVTNPPSTIVTEATDLPSTANQSDKITTLMLLVTILGAVVGLLGAVIIAMAVVLVCTCVCMKKRSTVVLKPNKPAVNRELFNPVYEPNQPTAAEPQEPTYDVAIDPPDNTTHNQEAERTYNSTTSPHPVERTVVNDIYDSTSSLEPQGNPLMSGEYSTLQGVPRGNFPVPEGYSTVEIEGSSQNAEYSKLQH